jgi:hypothetical protein
MMCPDTERITPNISAVEIMPSVLNDEADIVVARKVDGELDVPCRGGVDDVDWPAALGACGVWVGGGWAGGTRGPLGRGACRVVGAG